MPGWADYLRVLGQRVRAPRFRSLFLFVTSRCNSVCRTCFYFDKLNSPDDLSFEQIERISRTAPPFEKLWISGGEPSLRPELGRIITLFVHNNSVRNVNLPTNGLLPGKLFQAVDEVLESCPGVSVDLNFSLDGLADTHDAIRGVPRNFTRTLDTIGQAEQRYRGVRRLRRNVASVITRENYDELVSLGLHLVKNTSLDGQYFEVVRGQVPDPALKALTRDELAEVHRRLMPFHRKYAERLFVSLPAPVRFFATMYYLGNLRLHFDLHEACLEGPRRWPMPCTAGRTTLVIDHNGAFRACEMRGTLGRLQDFDLNVAAALDSPAMRAELDEIPRANCWCTHSCFIQESSKFSPRVQLFHIPWAYLRQRLDRFPELPLEELEKFRSLELV